MLYGSICQCLNGTNSINQTTPHRRKCILDKSDSRVFILPKAAKPNARVADRTRWAEPRIFFFVWLEWETRGGKEFFLTRLACATAVRHVCGFVLERRKNARVWVWGADTRFLKVSDENSMKVGMLLGYFRRAPSSSSSSPSFKAAGLSRRRLDRCRQMS